MAGEEQEQPEAQHNQGERNQNQGERNQGEQGSTGSQAIQHRPARSSVPSRVGGYAPGPFSMMRRFSEDMDRIFGEFFGPNLLRWGDWPERLGSFAGGAFSPQIELQHKENKFLIRADLPGMQKDDIQIDVVDDELSISGERHSESERNEGGYYRSERRYGSFRRTVPLPEGAKPETASARFENGVLEIELEAPNPEGARRRRIEIREGTPH
jgi:HSP20 family protein